jgi:hypothetical protein
MLQNKNYLSKIYNNNKHLNFNVIFLWNTYFNITEPWVFRNTDLYRGEKNYFQFINRSISAFQQYSVPSDRIHLPPPFGHPVILSLVTLISYKGLHIFPTFQNNHIQDTTLGTTIANQNLIQQEIERSFNSGNAWYHSVQRFCPLVCCLKT